MSFNNHPLKPARARKRLAPEWARARNEIVGAICSVAIHKIVLSDAQRKTCRLDVTRCARLAAKSTKVKTCKEARCMCHHAAVLRHVAEKVAPGLNIDPGVYYADTVRMLTVYLEGLN